MEDLKEINTTDVDVIMDVKRDKQALTPSSLISGKKLKKKLAFLDDIFIN